MAVVEVKEDWAPADAALEREILGLIKRAARFVDDQLYMDWLDLFCDEGVYGAITQENYTSTGLHLYKDYGKATIHERIGFLKGLWQTPRAKSLHLVTNTEAYVDVSGTKAYARSNFLMTRTGELQHAKLHACGVYNDKFVLQDGAWLFSERLVVVDSNMLPSEFTELL